jgi:predicted enzyme related to lactoylglutathione lyase
MVGAVGYFEVMGQDAAKLRGFFGELFGWKFEELPGMDYTLVNSEGSIPGGVGGGMGSWSTFYVTVESVDQSVERCTRLGGSVLMPPVTLPDGMRIAVIADPEGHPIGLSAK